MTATEGNTPNPLNGAKAKIERAKKHIQELETVLKTFFDSHPYKYGTRRNPDTQRLVYYLTNVTEVPSHVPIIAGDAIQNMRSALDYIAYQLVIVGKGKSGPHKYVYFPIFDSAKDYEAGKISRIDGMRAEAIKAIDAVKPYKGGNDRLWVLHQLNLADKHRLLIAVGSYFRSFDLGALLTERMGQSIPDMEIPILSAYYKPADRMCPLKVGDELFIDEPGVKVSEKIRFRFDVTLSEPQIVDVEPILETMHQLIDVTEETIRAFESDVFWFP